MFDERDDDILEHYGIERRSGRYPWGSGKEPFQRNRSFAAEVAAYKKMGLSEVEIAEKFGMNTADLRKRIAISKEESKMYLESAIPSMKEEGMTNVQIAKELGMSEGAVRNYLKQVVDKEGVAKDQIHNVADTLKARLEQDPYLDVGVGTEVDMGISRNKLRNAIRLLEEEGYYTHEVKVPQISDPSKSTTILVLTKDPDSYNTYMNSDKIKSVEVWTDDGGTTIQGLKPFVNIDGKKVMIRYAEDGGADKDGIIELRPNHPDLDLGASRYAQVRIGVDGTHYLKGMALYGENMPDGVDIIFNTNKDKSVSKMDVLKKMKDNPDNPFGTTINRQKGALNIVNEEGNWEEWSSTLSAQMLSKQPSKLIKERLDATMSTMDKNIRELDSLTNPIVKKHLMEAYAKDLESKASHLKAEGMARSKNHVLLPYPKMKPNEVYAPNYKNGEKVVLIRYPHGGTFEIPELTVNNKTPLTKGIKNAIDAIGIHPSVAAKLSGADFDGDTVMVIPNNQGKIKFSRSLKELRNFDPNSYKVDRKTISPRLKQTKMGEVSNLITDMTLKKATQGELARAVKHSMVVIDSEKHNLDWKQSAIDNGIQALRRKYQRHVNPVSGKTTTGASTLISKSKKTFDVTSQKTNKYGKTKTVKESKRIYDMVSDARKLSSGSTAENLYADYINKTVAKRNSLQKKAAAIPPVKVNPHAKKKYASEVKSLRQKVTRAVGNAPRERQAQVLANKAYYDKVTKYEYDKDGRKKLRTQVLANARSVTKSDGKKVRVQPTQKEWDAIQAGAVSNNLLLDILRYGDQDLIKKYATPKTNVGMTGAKVARARAMLSNGYTQAEVANALGVSVSTVRNALN